MLFAKALLVLLHNRKAHVFPSELDRQLFSLYRQLSILIQAYVSWLHARTVLDLLGDVQMVCYDFLGVDFVAVLADLFNIVRDGII